MMSVIVLCRVWLMGTCVRCSTLSTPASRDQWLRSWNAHPARWGSGMLSMQRILRTGCSFLTKQSVGLVNKFALWRIKAERFFFVFFCQGLMYKFTHTFVRKGADRLWKWCFPCFTWLLLWLYYIQADPQTFHLVEVDKFYCDTMYWYWLLCLFSLRCRKSLRTFGPDMLSRRFLDDFWMTVSCLVWRKRLPICPCHHSPGKGACEQDILMTAESVYHMPQASTHGQIVKDFIFDCLRIYQSEVEQQCSLIHVAGNRELPLWLAELLSQFRYQKHSG